MGLRSQQSGTRTIQTWDKVDETGAFVGDVLIPVGAGSVMYANAQRWGWDGWGGGEVLVSCEGRGGEERSRHTALKSQLDCQTMLTSAVYGGRFRSASRGLDNLSRSTNPFLRELREFRFPHLKVSPIKLHMQDSEDYRKERSPKWHCSE